MSKPNVALLSHEEAFELRPDLVEAQVSLESESIDLSRARIEADIEREGAFSASPTARRERAQNIIKASSRIQEWIEEQVNVRNKPKALKYIQLIEPECVAYLGLRLLWDAMARKKRDDDEDVKYTRTCVRIGRRLKDTVDYELFAEANPGLVKKLDKQLASTTSDSHSRAVLRKTMRVAGYDELDWDDADLMKAGVVIVQCIIESTGLFAEEMTYRGTQRIRILRPTEAFLDLLLRADENDPLLQPYRLPMVIPPKPWTSVHDGGYLDPRSGLRFVRASKAVLSTVATADLTDVFDAVNTIQATPWRVNQKVYEVFRRCHEGDIEVPGLAGLAKPMLPVKPWDEEETPDEDVLTTWKKAACEGYSKQAKWASARMGQGQALAMVQRYAEHEAVYFPHSLDFRGRVYPVAGVGSINPQGSDFGKSLLEFARGKKVTEEGFAWLCIHASNSYGVDKVSLDDRVLWANLNMQMIRECASDPFAYRDWTKADKPWAFLAACFELDGYLSDPEEFLSHLPVSVDGSCSGLQHFGAMMRCEKTAKAVNVIPDGDKPADVYSVVLERVKDLVNTEAAGGVSEALEWSERLSRTIVKQPVMTTPYGVSKGGIVGQIANNARKLIGKEQMVAFEHTDLREAAKWLGPLVSDAISTEIAAASQAMNWLESVARVTASANLPLYWSTPVGFLAVQDYRKLSSNHIQMKWAGRKMSISLSTAKPDINKTKQVNSIAPNFVHSMDATHLMVTANNCAEYGVTDFAMVHDSFGCHASDVPMLNAVLRECFIAIYSDDILKDFYEQQRDALPPEVFEKLDPPPPIGSLELDAVRDSAYFFA